MISTKPVFLNFWFGGLGGGLQPGSPLPPVAAPLNENTGFIICLEQAKRKDNLTFSLDV
jgi:hypothetical protein